MTAIATLSLDQVDRDLQTSGELLGQFYQPWDADDTRPLNMLRDAIESQQRALLGLTRLLDQEQTYRRALSARIDRSEYAR